MMPKFRKKPVMIEAIQWDGKLTTIEPLFNKSNVREVRMYVTEDALYIPTSTGDMQAGIGDWVILGVEGELYPCKPSVFEKTYEPESD